VVAVSLAASTYTPVALTTQVPPRRIAFQAVAELLQVRLRPFDGLLLDKIAGL
jgi:hypothetical protein